MYTGYTSDIKNDTPVYNWYKIQILVTVNILDKIFQKYWIRQNILLAIIPFFF